MTEKLIVVVAVVQLVIVSGWYCYEDGRANLIRRYSSLGPAGVDRSPWAPVESPNSRFTRDQGDDRRASGCGRPCSTPPAGQGGRDDIEHGTNFARAAWLRRQPV